MLKFKKLKRVLGTKKVNHSFILKRNFSSVKHQLRTAVQSSVSEVIKKNIVGNLSDSSTVKNLLLECMTAPKNQHQLQNPLKTVEMINLKPLGNHFLMDTMFFSRQLQANPDQFAQDLAQKLQSSHPTLIERVQTNPNGKLLLFPRRDLVQSQIKQIAFQPQWPSLNLSPKKILIDYSSPNMCKQLHVGHLRSMITGESLARILEFCGHEVDRVSHVGDFGVPIAVVIAKHGAYLQSLDQPPEPSELTKLYTSAKSEEKNLESATSQVLKQMHGRQELTPMVKSAWEKVCAGSRKEHFDIYQKLDIHVKEQGESTYLPLIPEMLEKMRSAGQLVVSRGAQCVFLDHPPNAEASEKKVPIVLVKSDDTYLYSTTDAAALFFRTQVLKKDWLIYCTDASQEYHFSCLFEMGKQLGWINDSLRIDHLQFGLIRDKAGKKLSSRDGSPYPLSQLLEETVDFALTKVKSEEERALFDLTAHDIAEAVAYNAIKFYDILHHRNDYKFDLQDIIHFKGRTAPYVMYASARIQSLLRKADIFDSKNLPNWLKSSPCVLSHDDEIELALLALQFPDTVIEASERAQPHHLALYLFELAKKFHRFYMTHRIMDHVNKDSRLLLSLATHRSLSTGMKLLALQETKQM